MRERDWLEGFEDEGLGAHWPAVSVGNRDRYFGGSDEIFAAAYLLAPDGERPAELRNTGCDYEVVTRCGGALERNFDLGHHKLEALGLQHVKTNPKLVKCVDSADLKVGHVHCVIDVVVRIKFVEMNPVWSHVRGHQVTVTWGHGRNHRRNRN